MQKMWKKAVSVALTVIIEKAQTAVDQSLFLNVAWCKIVINVHLKRTYDRHLE